MISKIIKGIVIYAAAVLVSTTITIIALVNSEHIKFEDMDDIRSAVTTVVSVNESSGVVVYSDSTMSLILTAKHALNSDGNVVIVSEETVDGSVISDIYVVNELSLSTEGDLAMVKVATERIIPHALVAAAIQDPKLADEIFVIGNPNKNFRSIKRGIVSSKNRFSSENKVIWEVDAGVIFGTSGGGAFSRFGKLFGIVIEVDALRFGCTDPAEDPRGTATTDCMINYLPFIGYVETPSSIREFLLKSKYKDYFDYLRPGVN